MVCKTWSGAWRAELHERKLPLQHVLTFGPELKSTTGPTVTLYRPCFACALPGDLPSGEDVILTSEGLDMVRCRGGDYSLVTMLDLEGDLGIDLDSELTTMATAGDALYVFDMRHSQLLCFGISTFNLRSSSEPEQYVEAFALFGDRVLIAKEHYSDEDDAFVGARTLNECSVVMLDSERLEEVGTLLAPAVLANNALDRLCSLAVLDDQLFASTRDATFGRVHVFSLPQGDYTRTVEVDASFGFFNELVAAHGRLYATECTERFEGTKRSVHSSARVLVLSPETLQIIHSVNVPEPADCSSIAARRGPGGREELLVINYDYHRIDVFAVGTP